MFSTFATLALLASGATAPQWKTDYSQALKTAAAEHKPVVVFIGKGETGYAKLVGGSIPSDAGTLLAQNYVCVYVNTDTEAGSKLASKFDISKGLVISGQDGNVQALRYTGNVSPLELTGYLSKYRNGSATTTETAGASVAVPVASGSNCASGNCGGTVIGSSCASGNCGGTVIGSSCANGQCSGTSSRGIFRRR